MKHLIVAILSLAVLAAGGVYAVHRYDVQHHTALLQAAKERAANSLLMRQQADQLSGLKAQCASDHAKYLAETPAQRALKTSVADCDPNLTVAQ